MGFLILILISLVVYVLFVAFATFVVKKVWIGSKTRHNPKIYNDTYDVKGYESQKGKWYPTGWVFNEETQLWQAPDYMTEQSQTKWRWDAEKKIWIDAEKEARMARYKEYHKDKPPTFEEWKAMRQQEDQNKQHPEN